MKRNILKFLVLGMIIIGAFSLEAGQRRRARVTQNNGEIGIQRAREIAARRAGVSVSQVVRIKTDYERGRKVYEGKIYNNGYEYEFDIDARTGQIVKWDVEIDD